VGRKDERPPRRARLVKETLRGLGFAELDGVRGGDNGRGGVAPNTHVNRPNDSRYCL
jgi:hypothetical protein